MSTQTTRKALASSLGITPKTLGNWQKAGAPIGDPAKLAAWIEDRRLRVEGKGEVLDRRRQLQCEVLTLQARRLRHECDIAEARVHDKVACSASITHALSDHLRVPLEALGTRLAAAMPEVPGLRKAVDDAVDQAFDAVRIAVGAEVKE